MGAIILEAAGLIEIGIAAYCITTKSNQPKVRSWVRIAAAVSFLLLTAVSVIEWSFRWYLLGLLMLVWIVMGALSLLKGEAAESKAYRPGLTIRKGIRTYLLVLLCALPVLAFPQAKLPAPTGSHKVETVTYTYTDTSRIETFAADSKNRKVTVEFWYPADAAGKYPVVLFDHGAFGMKGSNKSTFEELASHGYVVGSIDHPYHSLYTKDADGVTTLVNRAFMQEVQDVNAGLYDEQKAFELEQAWLKLRKDDVNFILDTIVKNASGDSQKVYQLVDTDKIGLFGHSLGGAASLQLGRDRKDVDAVINLDGDMLGEYLGVKDGKPVVNQAVYPVPVLSIWTDDMKHLFETVETGVEMPMKRIMATAPKAYEVYIGGTNHMSLTDLPLISPTAVQLIGGSFEKVGESGADSRYAIETMNKLVLEFFDANLKGQGPFQPAASY